LTKSLTLKAFIIQIIFFVFFKSLLDNQQSPIVKSKVIYALNECLAHTKHIDVQNLNIFPELIFDCLDALSRDESYLVRATIARTIAQFALTSIHYLNTCFLTKRIFLNNGLLYDNNIQVDDQQQQHQQQLQATGVPVTNTNAKYEDISYDKEYGLYQKRVIDIVMNLIADSQYLHVTSSNAVKEVLLRSNICGLCSFFGRQKTSEFLLPHMITILNEKNDW
jgi:phosphoinositide-3-kinase regulatory subunit 4